MADVVSGPIVVICGTWPPIKCGIGDFANRLVVELARQGREVVVVTDREAEPRSADGVQVLPIVPTWRPRALTTIVDAVRAARPAVVNLHYPTQRYGRFSVVDLLPLALRLRLGVPVVTTIHEFTTFRRIGRLRVRAIAAASDVVIVPALENRDALAIGWLAPRANLVHVPLGPPIEPSIETAVDRAAWRASWGIGEGTLVLAFFGFVDPSKGIDTLLTSLAHLPDRCDVRLWLLGDRTPRNAAEAIYQEALATQIRALPQPDRVTWTGYLDLPELSRHLVAADLAVLPFRDGATLRRTSLLTALAHGLPVLSTGDRSPCDGVEVVSVGDAVALARWITALHDDRTALRALAARAAEAGRGFSWPTIASQTAAVLERVARRPPET